jgi:hypothetical protein
MNQQAIINWLLEGDVAIQYQTHRDLLDTDRSDLRRRIATEGWGAAFLSKRLSNGHWGQKFYQPKWTSSHYTLLDLRYLCIDQGCPAPRETAAMIATEEKCPDGGVNPSNDILQSDVCLNGMFMNYGSYFGVKASEMNSVVDFILLQKLPDGGFNCRFNRSGARHSSLHSTLSVLEGITEYKYNGYTYRLEELQQAKVSALEFILMHQLYISDRTGKIIKKDFLKLTYPGRWRYDLLKALDYFQYAKIPWDDRMQPAINVLMKKRNKNGTWNVQAKHPGAQHFEMEKAGKPSRWNTLRALRVLKHFGLPT